MLKKYLLAILVFLTCLSAEASSHQTVATYLDADAVVLSFFVEKTVNASALQAALEAIDRSIELLEFRQLSDTNLPEDSACGFNMASIAVQNASQAEAVRKLDGLTGVVPWVPSSVEAIKRLSGGGVTPRAASSSVPVLSQVNPSGFTAKGIRIAVIDTGFSSAQWLLNDWQAANAINLFNPINLSSDDEEDFFDRFVATETSGFSYTGHGTAIAALSAANHPDFKAGASDAEVIPIKACNDKGECLSTHVIQGLCYALNNAPWSNGSVDLSKLVINLSFGTPEASKGIYDVLSYALTKGTSVVVSGGNEGEKGSTPLYPAAFGAVNQAGFEPLQGLIVVAALEASYGNYTLASFSSKGDFIDIAALGTNVLSANSDSLSFSTSFSGSSFAAPQVTSVIAQLKEALPNASPRQLESLIKEQAISLDCAGCTLDAVGAGLLNTDIR